MPNISDDIATDTDISIGIGPILVSVQYWYRSNIGIGPSLMV